MSSAAPVAFPGLRSRSRLARAPRPVFRRRLQAESLESRLALTAAAIAEIPSLDVTLAQYLTQSYEVGPSAQSGEVPVGASPTENLNPQAVDAALAEGLDSGAAGEGEDGTASTDTGTGSQDLPPVIVDFEVWHSDGWVYITGRITDEDPGNAHVIIDGLQFLAEIAGVDPWGNFSLARADEGLRGEVFANASDFYGNSAQEVSAWLL